ARRLADTGITVNALAPGLVTKTKLYRDLPSEIRHQLGQQPSRSIAQGAETAVWLARATEIDGVSGKFYEQRSEKPCEFRDLETEEKLCELCQAISERPAVGSQTR
ncbi:MAG: hypothetical protein LC790_12205, partial [Actinobacteria bacterium]|nr:hypothetical protein [Actinomycetota bacterium]